MPMMRSSVDLNFSQNVLSCHGLAASDFCTTGLESASTRNSLRLSLPSGVSGIRLSALAAAHSRLSSAMPSRCCSVS